MKYLTPILFLLIFLACSENKKQKSSLNDNQNNITTSELNTDELTESVIRFDPQTSIVLLPRDSYSTYTDHYDYISEEEYFETDKALLCHFDDSISIGISDNESKQGLADSLRLDMEWLCIQFPNKEYNSSALLSKAKTISHSYNDIIDYVSVTLLSPQNEDNYWLADIAFRGNYNESDFILTKNEELTTDELLQITNLVREKVQDENSTPPRPMETDTLLLDNAYKFDNNIIVAKYVTTQYGDSDGDYGNEALFIIKDGKIERWFAPMRLNYNVFQLRDKKYIHIFESTYATVKTTLIQIDQQELRDVHINLFFGD